jgi:dual specificity protein kinase YAK1
MLGQGTFGQVFKCRVQGTNEVVAVKVIKNQAAYYHQARVEIGILQFLNTRADPMDSCHIVRLKDFFVHKQHLCLVFECLSLNLFELVRYNKFRGLSFGLIRTFVHQTLKALTLLHNSGIIHCDIKPENILLTNGASGVVKVIDFGSACFANRTVYSYVQSRFYRSPEVVLGHHYTMAIDMWSLGCVAVELFLGLPLFPAASELDLLSRMLETLGPLPGHLLRNGKHVDKFFVSQQDASGATKFRLRTPEEYTEVTGLKASRGKQYFTHKSLADIINAYPFKTGLTSEELLREKGNREAFTDFLLGIMDVDPLTRWTPRQAQMHPFVTGNRFTGPFQPMYEIMSSERGAPTAPLSPFMSTMGLPMAIPHPRSLQADGYMDKITATLIATSPQMHAQAHAAAIAAVQMQMSLQQRHSHGRQSTLPADRREGPQYNVAHSLQRIMLATPGQYHVVQEDHDGSAAENPDHAARSLPAPLFSPPSRSFGTHLRTPVGAPTEFGSQPRQSRSGSLFAVLGSYQTDSGLLSSFEPASAGTYQSTLAAVAAMASNTSLNRTGSGGESIAGNVNGDRRQMNDQPIIPADSVREALMDGKNESSWSATETYDNTEKTLQMEDGPNPSDWDPLWSDEMLREDNKTMDNKDVNDSGLALAAQHLSQLDILSRSLRKPSYSGNKATGIRDVRHPPPSLEPMQRLQGFEPKQWSIES